VLRAFSIYILLPRPSVLRTQPTTHYRVSCSKISEKTCQKHFNINRELIAFRWHHLKTLIAFVRCVQDEAFSIQKQHIDEQRKS
jgi:hypothetical protein